MAIIQYTGIVNQIRGKLNGSVFNKARTVSTMQRKQQQAKGARGFQGEVRNFFSRYQRTWRTIGSGNQTSWQLTATNNPARDRFGDLVVLSGYNQFIKASMLAEYAGQTAPTTPYTSPAPPVDASNIFATSVVFSRSGTGATLFSGTINLDISGSDSDYGVIFDISIPVSTGVTTYHGRYTVVYGGNYSPTSVVLSGVNLGLSFPLPQTGQRMYSRARVVHTGSGAIVFEQINQMFFTVS